MRLVFLWQAAVSAFKQLLSLGASAEAESYFAAAHARFPYARYFLGSSGDDDAAAPANDVAVGALAQE